MEKSDMTFIQNQIGYNFKNTDLLQQAFVRRSYSAENGGADNEILEFIGDKVLDVAVVKLLTEKYGYMASDCDDYSKQDDWNEFFCEYSEGKLTNIKSRLVSKKSLAERIDMLAFSDYLIMGRGDENRNVQEQASVKEDLFEAILGAVAIDSNWNWNELQSTVEIMLNPEGLLSDENEDNYVELIQQWTLRDSNSVPLYSFGRQSYQSSFYAPFDGISQYFNILDKTISDKIDLLKYTCLLKIRDDLEIFRGFGQSKSEARKAVCRLAYEYLKKNDLLFTIQKEIENPNLNDAINQLEILARRDYFSLPTYSFKQKYDKNGNPIWHCICSIPEYSKSFSATASSKRNAKKSSAFKMLKHVLE